MRVRHVMSLNPVTCSVEDSCGHVARLMRDRGVGFVVCLREGRVAGICTDRDLAVRCLAEGLGEHHPCRDAMTPNPALVSPDETIFSVLDTMRSAGMVRRVPVVDGSGALVGVVSLSDLAAVAKDIMDAILAEELHNATRRARTLTGAKRIAKTIRRPTKSHRLPPVAVLPKTWSSREGVVRYPVLGRRRARRPTVQQNGSRGPRRARANHGGPRTPSVPRAPSPRRPRTGAARGLRRGKVRTASRTLT